MTGVEFVPMRKVMLAAHVGEKLAGALVYDRLLRPRSRGGCPQQLLRGLGAPTPDMWPEHRRGLSQGLGRAVGVLFQLCLTLRLERGHIMGP